MGSLSMAHWVIVLAAVFLVFGAGRLPSVMGDLASSIRKFRQGMREDDGPITSAREPVEQSG